MAKYKCIEDRQTNEWFVGISKTAIDWLYQMVEWRDMDDSWENDAERRNSIRYWEKEIAEGREENLIKFIDENWDLTFEKEEN